jgi:hypothetical protein
MQHREAQGRAEPPLRKRQLRTVAVHYFDIATGQADGQGLGHRGVDLHRGELGQHAAQHLGGPPRTRPELEDVVAELQAGESTGDDPLLDGLNPPVARAILEVELVHAEPSMPMLPMMPQC